MFLINFLIICIPLCWAIGWATEWVSTERNKQKRHRRTGRYLSKPKPVKQNKIIWMSDMRREA